MDESSSENRTGWIIMFFIAVVIAGWYVVQRTGAVEAIDDTVNVFVPNAVEMDRRTSYIDKARELTEMLNSR